MTKTAIIVGASRGLGLGLVKEYLKRGWHVIATERKHGSSSELHELEKTANSFLKIETVDINNEKQIRDLAKQLKAVTADLLYINAGVIDDRRPISEVSTEEFIRVMVTNALSPLRVIEALADNITPRGSIAVMSSGLGSVTNNIGGGAEVYRASKAALNMLMRSYAARAGGHHSLFAISPGHVRTDMGGSDAKLSVEISVNGIVDSIEDHAEQSGIRFLHYTNEVLPW